MQKYVFILRFLQKSMESFEPEKLLRGKTFERKVKQWGAIKGSSELQASETQHSGLNLKDFCSNLKDFCLNLNFCSNLKDFGLKPKKKVVYRNRKSCGFHNSQASFASRNLSSHNKTETSTQISLNLVNKNIFF